MSLPNELKTVIDIPMNNTRGAILIAAHNESMTLASCLEPLLPSLEAGMIELIVVSNGSSDDTAAIARSLLAGSPRASVLEIDIASKIKALRIGDRHLHAFPRVYLDADIVISEPAIFALIEALQQASSPVAGAPHAEIDSSAGSCLIRAYYRVWSRMPYADRRMIGTGIYGVNELGWDRINGFADVVNDDEWVARRFEKSERLITPGTFTVKTARTFRALVRQRARVEYGNQQLSDGPTVRTTSLDDLVNGWRLRQYNSVDAGVYVLVVLCTRVVAAWRKHVGKSGIWATDLTSRTGATEASEGKKL